MSTPVPAQVSGSTGDAVLSRRDKSRLATVAEIKATALQLMRDSGTTDARFTDIARVMGMTPPALYRYFGDSDELLTALIADGFRDLERAIAAAVRSVDEDDIGSRWLSAAQAYREWAMGEPQQFALVLGMPVPGYTAPENGPTSESAESAMRQLTGLFLAAADRGVLGPPLIRDGADAVAACQHVYHAELDGKVSAASFQAILSIWAMLHGFVHLEVIGHFSMLDSDARDALFRSHLRLAALASGLPVPPA